MIDLHLHSTHSDGSLTPAQLAERGAAIGLSGMALTDHDSLGGVRTFLDACGRQGMRAVSGVEISANVEKGTLHMLGYCVDLSNDRLLSALRRIRGGRSDRNQKILRKLNGLGLDVTWEAVQAFAGQDVVGRPHFAQALVAGGHVPSIKEAFNLYLAKGKPAYADRFRLSARESIGVIAGAGGVPVLAHPCTLGLGASALQTLILELKRMGLQGIEAHYSEHTPAQTDQYLRLAREADLIVTGGTDFHGEINPDVKLGVGFGSLRVPDELMDALCARAGR
jgi:predicted metal-dependent phosphoesterase TrpH